MFNRILVGYDGSAGAHRAFEVALELAKGSAAELLVLSVVEGLPHYAATVSEMAEEKAEANHVADRLLMEAQAMAAAQGMKVSTHRAVGHVARTIVDFARQQDVDLLVMGHSGRSGVWGGFLGTTAEKVSRYAHCTVMIVR